MSEKAYISSRGDPSVGFLFQDILDALVLEESEPSYDALVRWSTRYPEHKEALVAFFATWAVQAELSHDTPVDEERLANLAVSRALEEDLEWKVGPGYRSLRDRR